MKQINIKSVSILSIIFFLWALGVQSPLFAEDKKIEAHDKGMIKAIEFSDDENLLLTASRKTVKVWDVRTGVLITTFPEQKRHVLCLALSPDNKYLAVGGERDRMSGGRCAVYIWDMQSGTLITMLKKLGYGFPRYLEFSPDGKKLAVGDDMAGAYLFESHDWSFIKRESCNSDALDFKFSPDGSKFIVNSYDGTVTIFDTEKMERIQEEKKTRCAAVSWTDDSKEIILDGSGNLRLLNSEEIILSVSSQWNYLLTERMDLAEFIVSGGNPFKHSIVSGANMSDQGEILVFWDLKDGTINIQDIKENKNIGAVPIVNNDTRITISKSGKYLAKGNMKGEVFVWDLEMRRK